MDRGLSLHLNPKIPLSCLTEMSIKAQIRVRKNSSASHVYKGDSEALLPHELAVKSNYILAL